MYKCNMMNTLIGGRRQSNSEMKGRINRKIELVEVCKKIRISWKTDMRNLSNSYKILIKLKMIEVILK